MTISGSQWAEFASILKAVDDRAYKEFSDYYVEYYFKPGREIDDNLIEVAYEIVRKYGEASGAMAALTYDMMAELQGVNVLPAIPATPPTFSEVAKNLRGAAKFSTTKTYLAGVASQMVKRVGAETTLQNALRDGAEFAWVPNGDTCPYCIMLASRGWRYSAKEDIEKGHAEHIHSNCDCTYAVRFHHNTKIKGYDPDKYLEMYENADGSTKKQRLNSLRREFYAENSEKINAQKRINYAERKKELNESSAEEYDVNE